MINNIVIEYSHWLQEYFIYTGMSSTLAIILNVIIIGILFFAIMYLLDILIKKIVIQIFKAFSNKTRSTFDDHLVISNFPKHIAHGVPLLLSWYYIPILFKELPLLSSVLLKFIDVYIIFLCIYIFRSILISIKSYIKEFDKYKDKPLDSYRQVLMMFAWGIGIFFIVNTLTGYSTISIASMSAASAVILLIFKDTILGFVASIQVTVNDMVRIGDWITFSKYGADGNVIEINLATVRVQNFDKTYTTIPTYSLTSDSFQNWRGMQESGGRRIKRAIYIKQSTVKFLSKQSIEKYKNISLIKPYLEHRENDNDNYNQKHEIDKSLLINGMNQTNLGVFRKYIDAYLHENPAVNKDMFLMVRHLTPTDRGIPIEVYCFSRDKKWVNYEHIQADIFDHLVASAPYFDLEIFEFPTGNISVINQ